MADIFFAIRDETQVLQLLINFIRSPERDASYYALLNQAQLSYERPTEIKLSLTTDRSTRNARDAFIQLFQEMTTDSAETFLEGTWEPIAAGLVHLIARHTSNDMISHNDQQTIDEANGLNPSEYLLIYEGTEQVILQQFRKLMERRDRQTQLRVAFAKGNNGKQYTLFWIKDDQERQSLYQGLRVGGSITLAETRSFEVNLPQDTHTYRFFLPHDSALQNGNVPSIEKPHAERLRLLCELMMLAPELFGATRDKNTQTDVIGAVYKPDPDLEHSELLYLAGLDFLSESMILSDPNQLNLKIVALKTDPRYTQKLRKVVEGRAGKNGYRIQLRRANYSNSMTQDQHKIEYARLKSERSRVQDRLAQMDGLKQLYPILLRFSLSRTAILMDTLASYRPQDLDKIYYCFYEGMSSKSSSRTDAYHYLYIPPDVDRQLTDVLVVHDTQPDNPMSFWLDPYWAGAYHDKSLSEVYVPQGLLFSPPLHSWDRTNMDDYLRERFQSVNLPEGQQLLYVFHEVSDTTSDSKVIASVLDFNAFRSFGDTNVVGWINDNLILLSQLDTMQQDISTIADQTRREQFASMITESANDAMNDATRAQNLAQNTMQQHTDDMMLTIESEFNNNIKTTRNAIEKARHLNQRLVDVESLYETTERRLTETDRAIESTRKLVDEVTKRMSRLQKDVEMTIQQAQITRNEQHDNVENEIRKVQAKYSELVKEIRRLEDLL